jgi:hypothetical protein
MKSIGNLGGEELYSDDFLEFKYFISSIIQV